MIRNLKWCFLPVLLLLSETAAYAVGFNTPDSFYDYCQSLETETVDDESLYYTSYQGNGFVMGEADYEMLSLSGPDDGDPIGGLPLDGGEWFYLMLIAGFVVWRYRREKVS